MKKGIRVLLMGSALAVIVPAANATTLFNASHAIFHAKNHDENDCLTYYSNQLRFEGYCSLLQIDVVASVTHDARANPQTAQTVYVDGSCAVGGSCTLYSYDYDGTFLGSVTHAIQGTPFDVSFALSTSQQTASSYETLICTLPAHITGIQSCLGIYGVQVAQN